MSGIAGIVHFDGAPVTPGEVERMTRVMAYRGPDGIAHWKRGPVALGQCMLRTTPESLEERQPLSNEDASVVLVMDGRVDNWEELRRELLTRGAALRDRSDAELVLRAYEAWGRECLARIDGDFALVIWDARRREAFCARDRIGNKPFHYWWDGKTFAFASDAHAILALPWVREELNEGMLVEFLANEWHSPDETFWRGVLRLPRAQRMTVDVRGLHIDRYWEPDLNAALACTDEQEVARQYRSLLVEAVRRMTRSSRAVACEVSGGLDSSAILSVAEHLRREHRMLAPALHAYTLAFGDGSAADELAYARAVGDHLDLRVREVAPTRKPLSWYRETAERLRVFPAYPNGVMGLGIREEAASRGSRALLVGVGGDEWLSGSRCYYADTIAARDWKMVRRCLQADRRDFGLWRSTWWIFRCGWIPQLPRGVLDMLRRPRDVVRDVRQDRNTWLTPAMLKQLRDRRARHRRTGDSGTSSFAQWRQLQSLESPYLAHAREMEERLAALSDIELRRPFLDQGLVRFALAVPEWLRLRGRTDKYLHRMSMRGYLPETVRARETKAEFVITFLWHLPELEAAFLSGAVRARTSWVTSERVTQMSERMASAKLSGAPEWKLWSLFGCDALVARH